MLYDTLPVLMYHQVIAEGNPDFLRVAATQLEQQLEYIVSKGYNTISTQDLIAFHYEKKPLLKKSILLSFDDGYQNNFTNLYPLLKRFDQKATIFLTPQHVDQHIINNDRFLSLEEIKKMDARHIEFALHTFSHKSYADLSLEEISTDVEKTQQWFKDRQIPFSPTHAYTYGAFPKKDKIKYKAITKIFEDQKVKLAFRIGNRLNSLPLKDPFTIQRIDIRGTDSFFKFRQKLKFGAKYLPF